MSSLGISRLFGVSGYVAAVTGGSSGLGLMICKVSFYLFMHTGKMLQLKISNCQKNIDIVTGTCDKWR